jgi:serine/threonine protein phosphatase PrpC
LQFEIVTLSRSGARESNEDIFGTWHNERFLVCLVADGAGGHGGGDVAAAIVRDTVLDGFAAQPAFDEEFLRGLFDQANRNIVAAQAQGGKLRSMRSTAVLLVIDMDAQLFMLAHSGDSRAYLFRNGGVVMRTLDHSLVQQMVDSGLLDAEGARTHPLHNVLFSALGSITDPPEITISQRMQLKFGDALLLCSDGVWEPIGDACLLETLQVAQTPGQWTQVIETQVQGMERPGQDNYTAIALWTELPPHVQNRGIYDDEEKTQQLFIDGDNEKTRLLAALKNMDEDEETTQLFPSSVQSSKL